MPCTTTDTTCPLCGEANLCPAAGGRPYKGSCWCAAFVLPINFLRYLTDEALAPACFCQSCFLELERISLSVDDPAETLRQARAIRQPIEPDSYLDELGRTVFTASFLRKRGYCCDNGCRHCPYPKSQEPHE